MFLPYQHAVGQYAAGDQLSTSLRAAERYSQVAAATEARKQRAEARREARARRRSHAVAVA